MTRNEAIVALRERGMKADSIAKKLGCSKWTVYHVIKAAKAMPKATAPNLNGHSETYKALAAKRDKLLAEAKAINDAMVLVESL